MNAATTNCTIRVERVFRSVLEDFAPGISFSPDAHLVNDLGCDYFAALELIDRLESEFDIAINPDIFRQALTVGDVLALVSAH